MRTAYCSLFLLLATGACLEAEMNASEVATEQAIIDGTPTFVRAGIVRIRRANDPAVHTGVAIARVANSSLVLTSERWASWNTSPSTVTVGVPASGGTIVDRTARHINTTRAFAGAVIQINAVTDHTYQIDANAPVQAIGEYLHCYQFASDTQLQYVDTVVTAVAGDEVEFESAYWTAAELTSGDVGAPCFLNGTHLYGFVTSASGRTGTLQHVGSMQPWLDGMTNLAAVRDDSNSARLALYTLPNATSRMCLDVANGSPFQAAVNQYPCHYGPAQRWWLDRRVDSDHPRLVSESSGLCLDVVEGTTQSGADMQTYPCHTGANQRFELSTWEIGNGIRLRVRNSITATGWLANCVSVENGASTSSRRIEQRRCDGASDQRWYFHFNLTP